MKEPAGIPEQNDASSREARTYEGWISVFECSTDFEADLVRDRLDEEGLAAVVFTQRDHSFNLNVGDLAAVHVMCRPEDEAAARAVVSQPPISDADLEAAAMSADLLAPDAYSREDEAMLDSGIEDISFDVPDEDAYESDDDSYASDADLPGAVDRLDAPPSTSIDLSDDDVPPVRVAGGTSDGPASTRDA